MTKGGNGDGHIQFSVGMSVEQFLQGTKTVEDKIAKLNGMNLNFKFDDQGKLRDAQGRFVSMKSSLEEVAKKATEAERNVGSLGSTGSDAFRSMDVAVATVTGALATLNAALLVSFREAAKFEQAMAQLSAIAHFDTTDYNLMSGYLTDLSTKMPITAVDAAELARQAQLVGIHGVEGTQAYVDVMSKLSVVLRDVTGQGGDVEHTGEEIVKFLRSIDVKPEGMALALKETVNAMAALKTQFGVQIPQVIGLATYWSSFGAAAGYSKEQILAVSAGLVSVGARAQASGSSLTKFSQEFLEAINEGGQKAENFAAIIGTTTEEFETLARNDPYQVLIRFAQAMEEASKAGIGYDQILSKVGLKGVIVNRIFAELAKTAPNLELAMRVAQQGADDPEALAKTAEEATNNFNDRVKEFAGTFTKLKISIGNEFLPVATQFVEWSKVGIEYVQEFVDMMAAVPTPIKRAASALLLVGTGAASLKVALGVLLKMRGGVMALTGAYTALTAAQAASGAASVGGAAATTIAALGRQRAAVMAAAQGVDVFNKATAAVRVSSLAAGAASLNTVLPGTAAAAGAAGTAVTGLGLSVAGATGVILAGVAALGAWAYAAKLAKDANDAYKQSAEDSAETARTLNEQYGATANGAVEALVVLRQIKGDTERDLAAARASGDTAAISAAETRLGKVEARIALIRGDLKQTIKETREAAGDHSKEQKREAGDVVDRTVLGETRQALAKLAEELKKNGLDDVSRKIYEINVEYGKLSAKVKEQVKDEGARKQALFDINEQRKREIALVKAGLTRDSAKYLAEQQREAEKARVDAMAEGLAKMRAQRELDIDGVKRNAEEMKQKYAQVPGAAVKFEAEAQKAIKEIRASGAKADAAYLKQTVQDFQAEADKALAGSLTGFEKIDAEYQAKLAEIERKRKEAVAKVAGDKGATADINAAAGKLVQAAGNDREEERKKEQKEQAEKLRDTRRRLAEIRQAELDAVRQTAERREQILGQQRDAELFAARNNLEARYQLEVEFARRTAQARVQSLAAQTNADLSKLWNDLQDKLADPDLTKGERQSLVSGYHRDAANLKAQFSADVTEVTQQTLETITTATEAVQDARRAVADGARDLARAYLEESAATARTVAAQAQARQAVIQGLEQEVAAREANLTALRREGRGVSELQAAEKAVLDAKAKVRAAEAQDRAARAQDAQDALTRVAAQLAFAQGLTVSVAEQEALQSSIRVNLAAQAQAYVTAAQAAEAAGATQQEVSGHLDKAAELNRQIAQSSEQSRRAKLGELQAARDAEAAVTAAALTEAETYGQRKAARALTMQANANELAGLRAQIALYRAQGRSQADLNPLLERERTLHRENVQLGKEQYADTKALVQMQRDLTDRLRDFNAGMQEHVVASWGVQFASATRDAEQALGRAGASSAKLRDELARLAPGGKVAEGAIGDVGDAMERASSDTSKAAAAVAKLKGIYDALKSSAEGLSGALGDLATRADDQQTLEGLFTQAQANRTQAIENLKTVGEKYGRESVQYAEAMQQVAAADAAVAEADKTRTENRKREIQDQIDRRARDFEQQYRVFGPPALAQQAFDLEQKQLSDQLTKLDDDLKARTTALGQSTLQSLGGALELVGTLTTGAQQVNASVTDLTGKLSDLAKGTKVPVDLRLDPEKVADVGQSMGRAFVGAITPLFAQMLSTERQAPTLATIGAAQTPGVVNNTSYTVSIDSRTVQSNPDIQRLIKQLCDAIPGVQATKRAVNGG